jgi:hypothetical protein
MRGLSRESLTWKPVREQHGVIAHEQLRALGWSSKEIEGRLRNRRLIPLHRGVYAVGRPDVGRLGRWKAATLLCGDDSALSLSSAGALWGFARDDGLHVTAPTSRVHDGITLHRRKEFALTTQWNIRVTTPIETLRDLAVVLDRGALEAAISEADTLDLVRPDALKAAIVSGRPGARLLTKIFHRWDFVCTDTSSNPASSRSHAGSACRTR